MSGKSKTPRHASIGSSLRVHERQPLRRWTDWPCMWRCWEQGRTLYAKEVYGQGHHLISTRCPTTGSVWQARGLSDGA